MRTTDWNDWDTFCTVATLGSFTRAADRLGLPKSSVSTSVSRLEGKLGARLFERSTRRLRLTDAGEALLRDAGPLFQRLREVSEDAAATFQSPAGTLRIAMPYEFAARQLAEVVLEVMREHAGLRIEVDVAPRQVDPLSQGYDIMLTVPREPLPDSGLVAQRVFDLRRAVVVAPALLDRLGPLNHPNQLIDWPCLGLSSESEWQFRAPGGETLNLPLDFRMRTSNSELRLQAAVAGLGVARITSAFAEELIAAGALREVLAGFRSPPMRVYAAFPGRRLMPAKVKVFMDALHRRIEQSARAGPGPEADDPTPWPPAALL
ncbi:LysR family transcriptional regulator [Ralstonia solanacearum]|uniref:LysR family transcriptional regulator n=1 Tax=Ralstonia pseudosolanacearum TaxID=1310165 RepID=UPI000E592754|nr:LysR family transcriptional regulator [Ralstonia solanacearum]AXW38500.1 LysR family transcriptional regulator [Ralstonia solanacearum]AXW71356.1 LysR family transcriptional regulator [Ralstonia solanacearum]BEU67323.1 LysR family transcriptional regulator [Ralstonia pseudosolanacearum]